MARPRAQGQAMMSTAMPLRTAKVSAGSGPKAHHTPKVTAEAAITAGTNTAATRSTSRATGGRVAWAWRTWSTIRASMV